MKLFEMSTHEKNNSWFFRHLDTLSFKFRLLHGMRTMLGEIK